MNFDFKITTWERITVSEDQEEKVLQAIKEGKITDAVGIIDLLAEEGDMNVESERLFETDEQIQPDKNGGASTIEIMNNSEVIWDNSLK